MKKKVFILIMLCILIRILFFVYYETNGKYNKVFIYEDIQPYLKLNKDTFVYKVNLHNYDSVYYFMHNSEVALLRETNPSIFKVYTNCYNFYYKTRERFAFDDIYSVLFLFKNKKIDCIIYDGLNKSFKGITFVMLDTQSQNNSIVRIFPEDNFLVLKNKDIDNDSYLRLFKQNK